MKLAVLAAHTDDAETACAGLIINAVQAGHQVTIVNFTPELEGEEQNQGRARGMRSAALLGAEVCFLGFPDMGITSSPEHFARVERKLDELQADIILAHWPIDEHHDHRNVGILAQHYVDHCQKKCTAPGAPKDMPCPQLLFFEVITGKQTKCFKPDCTVELSKETFAKKCEIMKIFAGDPPSLYGSQWYAHHIMMMEWRAREAGACRHAEIDAGIWAEAFCRFPGVRGRETLRLPGER